MLPGRLARCLMLTVAVAGCLAVGHAPAAAQCPSTTLSSPTSGPLDTAEPAFYDSSSCSVMQGDHRTGRFSLHHCGTLSPTVITARDRFDVLGPQAGTFVVVTMRVLVEGWTYTAGCGATGCCGFLNVTLRSASDTLSEGFSGQTFSGRADFGGIVEMPVILKAGTPRDLELELYARRCAGGAHTVDASVELVFEGTDPNAYVFSCKGYGPVSVPVERRSWGSLKTMYR